MNNPNSSVRLMPINPPKRQIFYTNEQGNGILTAEELDEIAEACLAIPAEQVDQVAYNQSRWHGIHDSPRKRFFHYRGKILQVVAEVQKNGQRSHILTEEEKRERKRRHAEYEKMRRKNMPPEKKVEWKKREAERLKRNRDRINMNRWKREHANPEAWEKTRQKKRARYERRWNSLTEEQKDEIRRERTERAKERLAKMSEEERQKYLERQKESKRQYFMKKKETVEVKKRGRPRKHEKKAKNEVKSGDKQKKSCKNMEGNSKKDEEPSPSTSKNPNSNENIKLVAWAMWKNKMKPRQIHNFLKNSFGDVPTETTLRNWIKGFENDDANVDASFKNKTPAGRKRIKNETGIQEFEASKEDGRYRKDDDYVSPIVKRRGRLSRGKFEEDGENSRKELERIPRKRGRPRKIQSGCMVKSTLENQEREENASVLDTVEANTTKVLENSKDMAGIKLNDARREERMVEDELEEDFLEIE